MAVYLVLAVLGWFMWLKEYRQQDETYAVQAAV
jgi:hypothetical protein